MRTFIAIELPADVTAFLKRIQLQLKTAGADVKWVEPKNIHLTLKFLGEIEEKLLDNLNGILEEVSLGKSPFPARLMSIGAFPNIHSPRIIWAGISEGDAQIKQIAKELEEKIVHIGIPAEDRPFSSHITLGRLRSNFQKDKLAKKIQEIQASVEKENLAFTIKELTLFKSTLTPQGPIYEALKKASLKIN